MVQRFDPAQAGLQRFAVLYVTIDGTRPACWHPMDMAAIDPNPPLLYEPLVAELSVAITNRLVRLVRRLDNRGLPITSLQLRLLYSVLGSAALRIGEVLCMGSGLINVLELDAMFDLPMQPDQVSMQPDVPMQPA